MRIDLLSPLGKECLQLLSEIESLPASDQATKCSVMCSALLEKIAALPTKPKVSLDDISELLQNQAVNFNLPLAPTHAYQMVRRIGSFYLRSMVSIPHGYKGRKVLDFNCW